MITITNPGGLVIIVTLTKHENKRINNNNNGSQFHSLISNWEDMKAIRIEPNRTIATNQFDPKADFAPNELSLAIAQNTRQELMIIKPLSA